MLHKNLEASGQAYASAGSADPTTLKLCREISGAVLDGLDLSDEIQGACEQGFGEAVVSESGNGFALCHVGAGSEAGSGTAYVKFGAVRPGPDANRDFAELLDAAEGFAERSGAGMLVAGVSAGRRRAYEALLDRGYRILLTGLSMHRPGEPLFADPEHFVLDDWR